MFNWLHNYHPAPIFFSFGSFHVYWYGLFMVMGILAALFISFRLAKYYQIEPDKLFDLAFWLIINGIIGARIYEIFLVFPYYFNNPWAIFKIWEGGLAIHGAIAAGLITVYFFARKHKLSFWTLSSLIVPGLALGQAIGRFGNYFNQELFGLPTSSAWGIPIDPINRPLAHLNSTFFQPTFLYESLGCLLIFLILIIINTDLIRKNKLKRYYFILLTTLYMVSYSMLRFGLEFIRVDEAPYFLNLRWPQIASLLIILIFLSLLIFNHHAREKKQKF